MDLKYQVIGKESAPPLVLIHGVFGSHQNLRPLARLLATDYRCYLIDLPNHGESPRTANCSLPHLARCVHNWAHSLHLVPAYYLGHSLGGKVTMALAANASMAIGAAAILDIAPKDNQPIGSFDCIFQALRMVSNACVTDRQEAQAIIAQYVKERRVQHFLLNSLRKKNNSYQFLFDYVTLEKTRGQWQLNPMRPGEVYTGSILFLRGELSDFITDAEQANIYHHFPNAQIATVYNAGHWIHVDQLTSVYKQVHTFFLKAGNKMVRHRSAD